MYWGFLELFAWLMATDPLALRSWNHKTHSIPNHDRRELEPAKKYPFRTPNTPNNSSPRPLNTSHEPPATTTIPLTSQLFTVYPCATSYYRRTVQFSVWNRRERPVRFPPVMVTSLASFLGMVLAGHWPFHPPNTITGLFPWLDDGLRAPTRVMTKFPSFRPLIAQGRLFPITVADAVVNARYEYHTFSPCTIYSNALTLLLRASLSARPSLSLRCVRILI